MTFNTNDQHRNRNKLGSVPSGPISNPHRISRGVRNLVGVSLVAGLLACDLNPEEIPSGLENFDPTTITQFQPLESPDQIPPKDEAETLTHDQALKLINIKTNEILGVDLELSDLVDIKDSNLMEFAIKGEQQIKESLEALSQVELLDTSQNAVSLQVNGRVIELKFLIGQINIRDEKEGRSYVFFNRGRNAIDHQVLGTDGSEGPTQHEVFDGNGLGVGYIHLPNSKQTADHTVINLESGSSTPIESLDQLNNLINKLNGWRVTEVMENDGVTSSILANKTDQEIADFLKHLPQDGAPYLAQVIAGLGETKGHIPEPEYFPSLQQAFDGGLSQKSSAVVWATYSYVKGYDTTLHFILFGPKDGSKQNIAFGYPVEALDDKSGKDSIHIQSGKDFSSTMKKEKEFFEEYGYELLVSDSVKIE